VVSTDRFEDAAAGVLMEIPDFEGSAVLRAERVLAAMATLRAAGYALVLLPAGTDVRLKSKRRRLWRRERSASCST